MSLRPRLVLVVAVGALLLGLVAYGANEVREPDAEVARDADGDLAASRTGGSLPDLRLAALDDQPPLELGELRGPAVLVLWASWCGPCRGELAAYQTVAERYDGRVQVIGVDYQETRPDRARRVLREADVTFPVYADPDGALRAVSLPKLILVDAEGRVAFEQYLEVGGPEPLATLVGERLGVSAP